MDCSDCHEVIEKLNAYLDGELPSRAGAEVRDHLAACARCTAELEKLQRLNRALDELQGMVPPAQFPSRIRELALSRRQAADGSFALPDDLDEAGSLRRTRRALLSRVLTRVAAGVLVAGGLWMGLSLGGGLGTMQAAAAEAEQSQPDVIALQVHALSVLPEDSMAGDYVSFVSENE